MHGRKLLFAAIAVLMFGAVAEAGIVRHVVRPVVKSGAKATKSLVRHSGHVAKTVAY